MQQREGRTVHLPSQQDIFSRLLDWNGSKEFRNRGRHRMIARQEGHEAGARVRSDVLENIRQANAAPERVTYRASFPLCAGKLRAKKGAPVTSALQHRWRFCVAQLVKLVHREIARFLYHPLDLEVPGGGIDHRWTEVTSHEKYVVGSEFIHQ